MKVDKSIFNKEKCHQLLYDSFSLRLEIDSEKVKNNAIDYYR